jgi:DNA topoisomerase-3
MACNVCNVVITLFDDAHRITVSGDICGCGSGTLDVVFNKNKSPLEDGDTELSGCPFCHELLSTLIQVKRGAARHPMHRRGRGGRGRGRGGRGRGGKGKMSQLDNYFV